MSTESPAPSPYQAPAAQPGYNVLAVVGFVLSLLAFNVVAVILGFIALSQIKRTGERGRGLALAAIIIGFVSIALGILFFIIFGIIAAAAVSTGNLTTY
ncbi:DUF4190 domain-containing protein [Compostimonas suwonensis]|uniref:Uncharacterized protein DUF4190 n=1 Tax=Compostimonas suwonensis TaxID=1048394 RepID=A0A2M9C414_9MICO|nr:DUF4190 domain-containing protein [Compostimonas suwonensis]PJJ65252.1 uncharacterized protein DUF4190 [Compostimonas suwonensis]